MFPVGSVTYCPGSGTVSGPGGRVNLITQAGRIAERLFRRPGVTIDAVVLTDAMYLRPEEKPVSASTILRMRIKLLRNAISTVGTGDVRIRFEHGLGYAIEVVRAGLRREEALLREQFRDGSGPAVARSLRLVEWILGTGLERFEPPVPLPPISDEDVRLVCWMVVEADADRNSLSGNSDA